MFTGDLQNAIKRMVEGLIATLPSPRRGTVQSIDPNTMRAKIQVQPEGSLSGWLPLWTLQAGNGYGILAAPPPGTQVMVVPTDGYAGAGVVAANHWDNTNQPPAGYAPPDIWLLHQSGCFVKLFASGEVLVQDKSGATMRVDGTGAFKLLDKAGAMVQGDGAGNVTIRDSNNTASLAFNNTGQGTVTGNLIVNGYVHTTGDVVANGISLETHVHSGVSPGTGNSGPPV